MGLFLDFVFWRKERRRTSEAVAGRSERDDALVFQSSDDLVECGASDVRAVFSEPDSEVEIGL